MMIDGKHPIVYRGLYNHPKLVVYWMSQPSTECSAGSLQCNLQFLLQQLLRLEDFSRPGSLRGSEKCRDDLSSKNDEPTILTIKNSLISLTELTKLET